MNLVDPTLDVGIDDIIAERLVTHDAFGYQTLATSLCRVLVTTKPPFVLAVCAPWGAGKSSFLHYLVRELHRVDERHALLYFNAWYGGYNKDISSVFAWRIEKQLASRMAAPELSSKPDQFGPVARLQSKPPASAKLDPRAPSPDQQMTAESELRDRFASVCNALTSSDILPFVVIDELDRCKPSDVVTLLETIRMYYSGTDEIERTVGAIENQPLPVVPNNPFKFVLSIDEAYISRCFAEYHNLSSDDTYAYLSKFIQYRYHFPKKDYSSYINMIVEYGRKRAEPYWLPEGSEADFTRIANSLGSDSIREVRRLFAYLFSWQTRYFERSAPLSVIERMEEAARKPGESRPGDNVFRLVNLYMLLFAATKVMAPDLVSVVLETALVQRVARRGNELEVALRELRGNAWIGYRINERKALWLSAIVQETATAADALSGIGVNGSPAESGGFDSYAECAASCIDTIFRG